MNKKKPDIVVWDETNGYDANRKHYPTSIGSPKFELPNVGLVKKESSKKMIVVFNRQREEIIQSIEKLQREYVDSIMVWESKISFDPIVGETYYLYNFNGVNTLSLLSPKDWNRGDDFIGAFTLNSDRKWVRNER